MPFHLITLILACFTLVGLAQVEQMENVNFQTFSYTNSKQLRLENHERILDISFLHGLASGDPTTDSIILWTRVTPKDSNFTGIVQVYLKISSSPYFNDDCRTFAVFTNYMIDYTVKVDIDGLKPENYYYYQFFAPNGETTRVGRTKTLPKNDYDGEVKFAVYSCSNYAGGYFTAYSMPVIKNSVDYIVHLGDYIYEHANGDYTNGTGINRMHMPDREMWTLDDYRERYFHYHLDKDLQLSHSMYPWILVWDDHEIADNSWLRGSVNSNGWKFLNRREAGMRAYFEWLPIRPQENPFKIWRELKFGKQVDLLMLDTRHYSRDVTDIYSNTNYIASIADREERTMMGFDQEYWLYSTLNKSQSKWKIIGSQTVINHVDFTPIDKWMEHPFKERDYDSFDGYTANRRRLLSTVKNNNITGAVIISGDFHIAWVHELFLDTNSYDPVTGNGSLMVEFATSAISSPSTFPRELNIEQCYEISNKLVDGNKGILWNEGWFRGYFEMNITTDEINVSYFGVNVTNPEHEEKSLANFTVDKDVPHVRRNFEGQPSFGYLDSRVIN